MTAPTDKSERVFILGLGFQKCGTSWIYKYLQQSRLFNGGFDKEYHIWDAVDVPLLEYNLESEPGLWDKITRGDRYRRHQMQTDENEYFEYFTSLYDNEASITADITPSYSALSETRMSAIIDGFRDRGVSCKALLLIRDPVDRIKSAVRYNLDREYYKEGIASGETSFPVALEKYYMTEHCSLRTRYDDTLERVYSVFPREDVYVGIYENMFQRAQIAKISKFIGIDENYEFSKVRVNKTKSEVEDFPNLEGKIMEFYKPVYEYCNEVFPETRDLWR